MQLHLLTSVSRARWCATDSGRSREELVKFLRAQSPSLMETAKRCTDPRIAAELVSVAEMLHAKAEEFGRRTS